MVFNDDLKFGNYYELELLKYIDCDSYIKKTGYFKEYDIKIYKNNKSVKYEVKADRITYYTKNIAIEYECSNKVSGVITTKAKYYAYFVINPNNDYELYIIPVKKIIKYIMKNKYKKILTGGDNNKSKFYLFDENLFLKYKKNLNIE